MNIKQQYKHYCKPKLAELLSVLKLDTHAVSAHGNYIESDDGRTILDMVSGFGTAVLGHNHPEVVETAVSALKNNLPVSVQGTVRGASAKLAIKLNELLPQDSQDYCVNFSNSGTESIEAAIKHTYKVRFEKVLREYERLSRLLNDFYYRVERMPVCPELPGKNKHLIDFRDDLDEYNLAQFESFQNHPVMMCFKGGYHGKTISSLKVTFNKSFRESFEGLSAIQSVFIDPENPQRIPEVMQENVCTFYYPVIENDKVELKPVKLTKVIGLIFEIVMGEGGIKPLSEKTLEYLASEHQHNELAYIIDEIQTGCGRTGQIYGYADTALASISPEYITLSKALGGAIAKIGATLIRKDIYEPDFGILHTSTFGEDDFSSEIALSTLNILTRNGGEVLGQVSHKGQQLFDKLDALRTDFPQIIKEVRGKGLMLGVEFTALEERSPFFRAAGKQGVLSLLIASYLLEYSRIRVLAPLTTMLKGNPGKKRLSVIRIQPPVTVTDEEIQRLIDGLREVCRVIQSNNEFCLLGHLIGAPISNQQRKSCRYFESRWPVVEDEKTIDARAGFIVHPINLKTLIEYYFPSFESYNWEQEQVLNWWNGISRFLEPVHVKNEYVTSNEFTIEVNLVFVPYLPVYINTHKNNFRLAREMRDKVQDAVNVARELGDDNIPVSIVGLGAYTSIITQNAQTINDYEVPVTTGNAYTVGLTIQGILKAAQQQGLDITQAKVVVVGAAGNIGLVIAQILFPRAKELTLLGSQNPGSEYRLRYARQQCLYELLNNIKDEQQRGVNIKQSLIQGQAYQVYKYLIESESVAPLKMALETGEITLEHAKTLEQILPEDTDLNLKVTTETAQLEDYDIIVIATNTEEADLIRPEQLKPGAIVCCTSVPSNLSDLFNSEDTMLAFDGGLAKLPESSKINFVGMPKAGLAYGCLAETLVLAFDGQNHSYSKGVLAPGQVYQIMEKAALHGFDLGGLKFDDHTLILDSEPEHSQKITSTGEMNV